MKMKRKVEKEIDKTEKCEKKRREDEQLEKKAQRLRGQAKCRIFSNPDRIELKTCSGRNLKIMIEFSNNYHEIMLRLVADEFKDSILIEEIDVRLRCLYAIKEYEKKNEAKIKVLS